MIIFLKQLARKSRMVRELHRRILFLAKTLREYWRAPNVARLFFRVLPYTMVSFERLSNTYTLALRLIEKKTQGAFVECGVWRGGAAGVMAAAAAQKKEKRQVWLFDSFEGLPEPTSQDGARAKEYAGGKVSGTLASIEKCVGPLEDVRHLFFRILRLQGDTVHIEQGWFQDTLAAAREKVGPIALLRMDADWYESTKCILENLFDNVVEGGYIIIDDYYCWEGCKKAVDEFLAKRNTSYRIVRVDREGAYFQK